MYQDLNMTYWWYVMKQDVEEYVTFVILVRESRQNINLCECMNENGKRLVFSSLWGYLGLNQDTISTGLL
jgi:hypothetical protein